MSVTAQQWIEQVTKAGGADDWMAMTDLERRVCQSFADARDWDGLERFFTEALAACVTPQVAAEVTVTDGATFQAGVAATLREAVRRAGDDAAIKAIYFEYAFDGDDEAIGSAFLCTAYDSGDDDWAAQFEDDIAGPTFAQYFDFDRDGEYAPLAFSVAQEYVHGFMLAAWGRAVDSLGELTLPMGFARHDHPVIVVKPLA